MKIIGLSAATLALIIAMGFIAYFLYTRSHPPPPPVREIPRMELPGTTVIGGATIATEAATPEQVTAAATLPATEPSSRFLAGQVVHAIALDTNQDKVLNLDSVLSGQDALLGLSPKREAAESLPAVVFSFNNMMSLREFDLNGDGWINPHDPVYNNLKLMYFHPRTKTIHFVPLNRSMIQAITLDINHLQQESDPDFERFDQPAAHAVMAGNFAVKMKLIPINQELFDARVVQPHPPLRFFNSHRHP